jgi:hypothetical protein
MKFFHVNIFFYFEFLPRSTSRFEYCIQFLKIRNCHPYIEAVRGYFAAITWECELR